MPRPMTDHKNIDGVQDRIVPLGEPVGLDIRDGLVGGPFLPGGNAIDKDSEDLCNAKKDDME